MEFANCLNLSARSRRHFFQSALASALLVSPAACAEEADPNVLVPAAGYSPRIGVLVAEMTWMRDSVVRSARDLTLDQLDFLLDAKANRIGALLLHMAATERLYQLNTFDRVGLPAIEKSAAFKGWAVPMQLGDPARNAIKGHALDYYLTILHEHRERTLAELRKRDDRWLMAVDQAWVWGPTNNLCKWFHVCEHESHHDGQIALLRVRVPGRHGPAPRTGGRRPLVVSVSSAT
jgi:uncharacterized damage-inducible protein DinB